MRWEKWQQNYWIPDRDTPKMSDTKVKSWQRARIKKRNEIHKKLRYWNKKADEATPPHSQCRHLIEKFGGIIPFSIAVGYHPEHIIGNWLCVELPNYPDTPQRKRFRTHGLIPPRHLARLLLVARYWGVLLKPEDVYPDYIEGQAVKNLHTNEEIYEWIRKIGGAKDMKKFEHIIASLVSTRD